MLGLDIWTALGILALVCLIVSFVIGKNAIWGGLTMGIIVALIVGVINLIMGNGFKWVLLKKILIIAVLAGGFFEVVGRLSKKKQ
jgi:hypothetical protein